MNISNIKVGDTYKNYKELCNVLGEDIKRGKKKAQIKEWECYFDYDKQGHMFIITEIFDIPKDKHDLRTQGNNRSFHIEYIELLLLDLLLQDNYKGKLFLSRNRILRLLEMINDNYSHAKYRPSSLLKVIDVDRDEIKDFYTTTDDLLKRNLETALNCLEKKRLIFWTKIVTVCFINTSIETNELNRIKVNKQEEINEDGEVIVTFDVAQPVQREVHRKATETENRLILEVERQILDQYNYTDISDVFKNNKAEQFYKEVNAILLERGNINYYYRSYEITCNEKHVLEKWKSIEELKLDDYIRKLNQEMLNSSIINKIEENAEKRHDNAILHVAFGDDNKKSTRVRSSDEYVNNTRKLTKVLINRKSDSLTDMDQLQVK